MDICQRDESLKPSDLRTAHGNREEYQSIPLNMVGDHILNRLNVIGILTVANIGDDAWIAASERI